ncbi:dTDP-4-dehydrorhamnose reductase [Paenibacillus residui]|uniref:dTDP-4-dehydrorhamnose reductase n=1 Tax=Paenibacillus residui TaxID=629724 RepID=A0ABW3D868_9BACL
MKILITGAAGQLGKELSIKLNHHYDVYSMSRAQLDITQPKHCNEVIGRIRPDVVIHAAAFTSVDLAETQAEEAYKVNVSGTRNVAVASEKVGAKFCYISTDYVFDGQTMNPYREIDLPNPIGIYGKTKWAGEEMTRTLTTKFFIVRTSWVYGMYGNNFVKTMLKLAKERDEIQVVNDQTGSPTYTADLADFIEKLILTEQYGIYHASNSGSCTWYQFTKAIFEECGTTTKVIPCTTEEFPRPAPRPKFSVLDHLSLRAEGFEEFRHWRDALRQFLNQIKV